MTTTMTTIQEMLREISSKGVSVWGHLQIEAANRIDALEAERDTAMQDAYCAKEDVKKWIGLHKGAEFLVEKYRLERDAAMDDVRRMDYLGRLLTHIHSGDGGYLNTLKFELFTSLVRHNLRTLVDAAIKDGHE